MMGDPRQRRLWLRASFLLVLCVSACMDSSHIANAAARGHKVRPAQAAYAYALGDSVMEGAAFDLGRRGIVVNAVKGRQFIQGISILQEMRASGRLPRRIVIGLGTNGPFTAVQFSEMMQVLRGVRRIVFVTVKEPLYWEYQVNDVIRTGARHWPAARIADWYAFAAAYPAVVCCDGIHIGPAGARAYAQIVSAALR